MMATQEKQIPKGVRLEGAFESFLEASRWMPHDKRVAVGVVHWFCLRVMQEFRGREEDLVGVSEGLRDWVRKMIRGEVEPRGQEALFHEMATRYGVPCEFFFSLIQALGARTRDFEAYPEWNRRCHLFAAVWSAILKKILSPSEESAAEKWLSMGQALQLMEGLLEIRQRAFGGGGGLPVSELEEFQVRVEDLAQGRVTLQVRALVEFQVCRIRGFVERAAGWWRGLPDDGSLFAGIYLDLVLEELLRETERRGFDVLSRPLALSWVRRLGIRWKVYRRKRLGLDSDRVNVGLAGENAEFREG